MGRVTEPALRTKDTVWLPLLLADYVSQTETGYTQTIPLPQPFNYLILKSGSDYYAINGADGAVDYGGSADAGGIDGGSFPSVFNAAVLGLGALNVGSPGTIAVRTGTYTVDSDLTIGKKTHVRAEPNTLFDVTANLTLGCLVVDPTDIEWTDWAIEGIRIDMNSYNGAGIYTSDASYTSSTRTHSAIKNMQIREVKATYAAIDLTNIFCLDLNQVGIATSGTGLKISRATHNLHFGNSLIRQLFIGLSAVDSIGIDIIGSGGYRAFNLSQFDRLQIGGAATSYDGTIGIRITDDTDIAFDHVDLEGSATQVYLDGCNRIDFNDPFIWSSYNGAANYGVRLVNATHTCMFKGGYIATGGTTAKAYSDESTYDNSTHKLFNVIAGTYIYGGWDMSSVTLLTTPTFIWNSAGRVGLNSNSGTSTGTGAEQTIAHGLGGNPGNNVQLSYTSSGAAAFAYLSTPSDATNIYVTAANTKNYTWVAWL